jgi:hypothetical protein
MLRLDTSSEVLTLLDLDLRRVTWDVAHVPRGQEESILDVAQWANSRKFILI